VQEIFENTVDIAHFQFVHGVSGFGAVELVQDGPMFRSIASVTMKTPRGEVNGAVESELWGLGLDYVRQRGLGPGKTIFAATPVEEELVRASYTFFVEKNEETGEPSNYGNGLMREFSRQITRTSRSGKRRSTAISRAWRWAKARSSTTDVGSSSSTSPPRWRSRCPR
jgi:hypothetical protein